MELPERSTLASRSPGAAPVRYPFFADNKFRETTARAMKFGKLGSSDLLVSNVCLGTMTWGSQNTEGACAQPPNLRNQIVRNHL
jgi:hypothetical protein